MQNFDAILGDRRQRYLATGYRRVCRSLEISPSFPAEGGELREGRATATVAYPPDWSHKPGGTVAPHLSSLDGMLLGEELARTRARSRYGETTRRAVLTDIDIKAGAKPIETRHPLDVTWSEAMAGNVLTCHARIAGMRVTATARIARERERPAPRQPDLQEGADVESWVEALDLPGGTLQSLHTAAGLPGRNAGRIPDQTFSLSLPDFLRLAAQAAQLLIYETDGISRSASNNIWMRRASFTVDDDITPPDRQHRMVTQLVKENSLSRAGYLARTFEVEFSLNEMMHCTASLAYSSASD